MDYCIRRENGLDIFCKTEEEFITYLKEYICDAKELGVASIAVTVSLLDRLEEKVRCPFGGDIKNDCVNYVLSEEYHFDTESKNCILRE